MFVVERAALSSALATVQALAGSSGAVAALTAEEDGTLVVAAGDATRGAV